LLEAGTVRSQTVEHRQGLKNSPVWKTVAYPYNNGITRTQTYRFGFNALKKLAMGHIYSQVADG